MKKTRRFSSLAKMMQRYVLQAVGIALLLLLLTLVSAMQFLVSAMQETGGPYQSNLAGIAQGLTVDGDAITLTAQAQTLLRAQYDWGMLLDETGNVIWEQELPDNFARRYSAADIATFSGWYLNDYPVVVWRWQDDALLVLGRPIDSMVRYKINMESTTMTRFIHAVPMLLISYIVVAFALAIFLAYRMYRRLRPLTQAVADLAEQKAVSLPTGGVLQDVAVMLNQVSEALARQRTLLQARDASRASWIAGISHDIRTPLSMVMGYASQLEHDETLSAPQRQKAAVICKQSLAIKTLVADLNLSSNLAYGWENIARTPLFVAPLLRSIVAAYLNDGLPVGFQLSLDLDEVVRGVQVLGNEGLLVRMMQNLINNSLHHNAQGCNILVAASMEGRCVRLVVSDTGQGMQEAPAPPQPGHAWEETTHGLGLAIVSQIAKLHGGCMNVSPNVPQGVRVAVLLPCCETS